MIEGLVQFVNVIWNNVRQISVFGLLPHVLHGIKLWRIRWQPFDAKPLYPLFQKLAHGGPMSRQTVTHEYDRTTQVRMDFMQEANEIGRPCVVVEQFVVETQTCSPRCEGHSGQRRDPVVTIPDALDRRMSFRCPHPSPQRLQQIATFIKENQASLPCKALFLAAARFRDASGRCHARFAHALAVPASADSNRVCEEAVARNRDESPGRRGAGSCPGPTAPSTPTVRIPNNVFLETKRPPIPFAVQATAWIFCRREVWPVTYFRVARPCATDGPKKRCNQSPRPLRSTSSHARTIEPRSSDELRALRGFLMVSCTNCSAPPNFFH